VAENLSQCHRVVPCRVVPCRRRGGDSTRTRVKDDTEIGKTRSARDFLDSFRSVAGLRHLFFSLFLSLSLSLSYSGTGLPRQTTDRTMKSRVLNGSDV